MPEVSLEAFESELLFDALRAGRWHHMPAHVQPLMQRRETIIRRLLEKVQICPETGCWLWTGGTSGTLDGTQDRRGGGYPRFWLDGQMVAAHRAMFVMFAGFVPGKKEIDHTCRNRLCINPAHLELVSRSENKRRIKCPNGVRRRKEVGAV